MQQSKLTEFEPSDDGTPLYLQLANQIRQLILDGDISFGDALPSERKLVVSSA